MEAKSDNSLWTPIKTKVKTKKVTAIAKRPLMHPKDIRTLKLGTTRKWIMGFFDMQRTGAFSKIMDLKLESAEGDSSVSRRSRPEQDDQNSS